jgi:hypothetical protein
MAPGRIQGQRALCPAVTVVDASAALVQIVRARRANHKEQKMSKLIRVAPAFILAVATVMIAASCDGKFAGPPGGSAIGTPGKNPLLGVTPFTFAVEDPLATGFYNDIWYIDPGRDADDGPTGQTGVWFADTIQTLGTANFSGYMTGGVTPSDIEVNHQYPLMVSFMCQWFRRNGDGSRIRERDQFGLLVWSSKSLDINFVTAPVEPIFYNNPPRIVYEVYRPIYPNGIRTSVLFGYTSPPPNQPGDFPPPQSRYLNRQFSELGLVLLTKLLPAGAPQLTQSLGLPLADNEDNDNVENAGAIPQALGGGWTNVQAPTGIFGDLFALEYNRAPVIKPTTPGIEELEAVIEYSRHLGALQANVLTQMIGLASGKEGTLTDSAQVVWQNGYGYTFDQLDLDKLNEKHLPGTGRDPRPPEQRP